MTSETTEQTNTVERPTDTDIEWSHDDYLKFAQYHRVNFVKAVVNTMQTPEGLVELDPDRQANYLAALRDIEKQVFVQQKLKQDADNNDARNNLIATIIVEQARNADIAKTRQATNPQDTLDASKLPMKNIIPGETSIGDSSENYADFMGRTSGQGNQDPLLDFGVSVEP